MGMVLADVPIGLVALLAGATFIAGLGPVTLFSGWLRYKRHHIPHTRSVFIRGMWTFAIVATSAGGVAIAALALAIYDIPPGQQMTLAVVAIACIMVGIGAGVALLCLAAVENVRLIRARARPRTRQ